VENVANVEKVANGNRAKNPLFIITTARIADDSANSADSADSDGGRLAESAIQ
jgi:hypothetical protein